MHVVVAAGNLKVVRKLMLGLGLVALLVFPPVMGESAQEYEDPAGDVQVTLGGLQVQDHLGCDDPRVDFTRVVIASDDDTLDVTFTFVDLDGGPDCSQVPISLQSRYRDTSLFFGESFSSDHVEIWWTPLKNHEAGYADISARINGTWTSLIPAVTSRDGNSIRVLAPMDVPTDWTPETGWITTSIRGMQFETVMAFAQSRAGDARPEAQLRFTDRVDIGPYTL